MERFVIGLSRVMGVIAASAVVVLMLAIVVDVTFRFFTNASVPAMLELSESALVVAIFFGLAWSGVSGAHVSVTLVSDRLGERTNRIFSVIVWGLSTGLVAWFIHGTLDRAISATERGETRMGLVQFPIWPLRWVIVVGLAALLLVCVVNFVRAVRGRQILPEGISEQQPPEEHGQIDARANV